MCLASVALLYHGGRFPFSQVSFMTLIYMTLPNSTAHLDWNLAPYISRRFLCWWFLGTKQDPQNFPFHSWKVSWMESCPEGITPFIAFCTHPLFFSLSAQALALKYNFLVPFLSSNYTFCIYFTPLAPFHYRPI